MSLDGKREHLVYFDYFRAISIILIVMGHSYGSWERDSVLDMSFTNLISGGTALFVFISGFFFHNVFNENYNYKAFVLKKCEGVFLPLLIYVDFSFEYIFFNGWFYSISNSDWDRASRRKLFCVHNEFGYRQNV